MTTELNLCYVKSKEDDELKRFVAPEGGKILKQEGLVDSIDITNVARVTSVPFTFNLSNGNTAEQTRFVNRPPGSGFILMLQELNYAFVKGGSLTQRPLGQFLADIGMRGFNTVVCRVRLTDENADDSVFIEVTVGVLFFN